MISVATDLVGVGVGYLLIESNRKYLYLGGYAGLIITDLLIAITGIYNKGEAYKYLILFFRFFQSAGVGSVYWGYVFFFFSLL